MANNAIARTTKRLHSDDMQLSLLLNPYLALTEPNRRRHRDLVSRERSWADANPASRPRADSRDSGRELITCLALLRQICAVDARRVGN
jgi:hypothetical protein